MRLVVLALAALLLAAPASGDELVRAVQEALTEQGFDPGPSDGLMGPRTREAIGAFQEARGLEPDGLPSEALLDLLTAPEPEPVVLVSVGVPEPDPGPRWRVAAGHIEQVDGLGLRSLVRFPLAAARPEELVLLVVGSLGRAEPATSGPPRRALARLEQPLPADFTIAFDLEVDTAGGVLDIGPYLGAERIAGYRLTWLRGERERLLLRQVSPQGYLVVAQADDADGPLLEPGRVHRLRWSRDEDGRMRVEIDDRAVLATTDRAFPGGFDGLLFQNLGGSYTLRDLGIDG